MSEHTRRKKARDVLRRAGYKSGGHLKGDEREDKAMIEKAIAQHESHDHKGEAKTRLHFRDGGLVDGFAAGGRPDKKSAKHKGKTTVNVMVAPQGAAPHPVPVPVPKPVPVPAGAAPGGPAGGPPMPMPPPAAGLRPGMGPMKDGGRARRALGGATKAKPYAKGNGEFEGGAGGALGRLEKAEHEEKRAGGRRSAGK